MWLEWTQDERARVAALLSEVEAACPGLLVSAHRRDCNLLGVPLPEEDWRWQVSVERDEDGRAHQQAIETHTLDDMERVLPKWLRGRQA